VVLNFSARRLNRRRSKVPLLWTLAFAADLLPRGREPKPVIRLEIRGEPKN
jgi:hypothetical protein